QLFLAGAALQQINRREDATVGELAVQVHFTVTRALELFKDHLVHLAAGIDQRRGDNREAAAFFDVTRRAEEPLRTMQRVTVHAAGQDLTAGRNDRVIGTRQAGDGVEQDDDILAKL